MGNVRFGAPRELILFLKQSLQARVFVETGTNKAETSAWAADHFERVFTIEGFEPLYKQATERYRERKNISFVLGDSRTRLPEVLATINEPAVIWLDAHWCAEETFGSDGECPVIDEIEAVNQSGANHLILVDDARLFLAPPPPPHRNNDWPQIWEICQELRFRQDRFVIVYEDVIVSGPPRVEGPLVEFIRSKAVGTLDSGGRSLGLLSRGLRRLGVR
jgi:hypothetical protein